LIDLLESEHDTVTRLGGRHPVIPSLTGQLIVDTPELKSDTTWPSKNLNDVINDLADNGQVVLSY